MGTVIPLCACIQLPALSPQLGTFPSPLVLASLPLYYPPGVFSDSMACACLPVHLAAVPAKAQWLAGHTLLCTRGVCCWRQLCLQGPMAPHTS